MMEGGVQRIQMEFGIEWYLRWIYLDSFQESMICFQIGMIHRGEVDLAPCSFYLTAERKEVVDFSVTLDYAELISGIVFFQTYVISCRNKLFFKFPGRDIGGFWGLFKPLALESWLAILLFSIVVPGFLFLCFTVLKKFRIFEAFSFGYGHHAYKRYNQLCYDLKLRAEADRSVFTYFCCNIRSIYPMGQNN